MHSSFGKRILLPYRLRSRARPPPSKSCLAASCSDREPPSGEPRVRKTVHFPDDESLRQVRVIPPREHRPQAIIKRGQITETKSFFMYTSRSSGSNQRFLLKRPGLYHYVPLAPQPIWVGVVRARRLAAAYCSQPRPPRSASSSNGLLPEPATESSLHDVFDMSSLKAALPEIASARSSHGSAFNMSSMLHALPDPDPSFNMTSLMDALPPNAAFDGDSPKRALSETAPEPHGFASDMSPPMRALPDPDASSDVSSLALVPQSMVASHSPKSHKVRSARVMETHVEAGPFSVTYFFNFCGLSIVVMCFCPWIAPVIFAAFALLFLHGAYFF